ncbi:Rv1733c family protein [Mycolicibacterium mengxianglii]|uniref:Rv1733c family protein n=1 Tax=Mycolicibacterium mengxianglii TaxID=2736649 RepID=UPI0018EECE8F|nr:hypothetical protein [Mycolicibacterium mengxianglii]
MSQMPFVSRCRWVLRALGRRNPLIRTSDRLEALAIVMVFVVALLAIPFASQAGDNAYDAHMRLIDEQLRTRHSVEAVVVPAADSSVTPVAGRYTRTGPTRAQWREGDEVRTEVVPNPTAAAKGEPVTVWLDSTGKVVAAPDTPQTASAVAAGRSWTVWSAAVVLAVLMVWALRKGLDRFRATSWERELQLLARNDDGWANRHT